MANREMFFLVLELFSDFFRSAGIRNSDRSAARGRQDGKGTTLRFLAVRGVVRPPSTTLREIVIAKRSALPNACVPPVEGRVTLALLNYWHKDRDDGCLLAIWPYQTWRKCLGAVKIALSPGSCLCCSGILR